MLASTPFRSFVLCVRIVATLESAEYEALRASLADVVSARDLRLVGDWSLEPAFVVRHANRPVDAADRRAVAAWAAARRELVDYTVGPLVGVDDPRATRLL